MNKQTLLLSMLALIALIGLSTGAYFLLEQQPSATPASSRTKNSAQAEQQLSTATDSSSTLSVKGIDNTTPQPSAHTSNIPTPENFEIYEQYASSENTQYQDIVVGSGDALAVGDTAVVVYSGWLTDGTLFDQSRKNEQGQIEGFPVTIGAGQVIRGWEEGLIGMKAGGTRRLIIPSSLGYGEAGQGPIPPNAMLIFDVELAQIQKPQP